MSKQPQDTELGLKDNQLKVWMTIFYCFSCWLDIFENILENAKNYATQGMIITAFILMPNVFLLPVAAFNEPCLSEKIIS